MKPTLEAALGYARLGWRVLPCRPGAKPPLNPNGVKGATADEAAIQGWWAKWPNANIGIAADAAVIVDVDPGATWPADEGQRRSLKATCCPLARTPRGGWHLFFRQPDGRHYGPTVSELAIHVDTRAGQSYVLASPSCTEYGQYQWIRPLVPPDALPLPPAWLQCELDRIAHEPTPIGTAAQAVLDNLTQWPQGTRNANLFRLGCRLRHAGLSAAEIESALQRANVERCQPPLPPGEVAVIARSAARYPAGPGELPYAMQKAWAHAVAHRRKLTRRQR